MYGKVKRPREAVNIVAEQYPASRSSGHADHLHPPAVSAEMVREAFYKTKDHAKKAAIPNRLFKHGVSVIRALQVNFRLLKGLFSCV